MLDGKQPERTYPESRRIGDSSDELRFDRVDPTEDESSAAGPSCQFCATPLLAEYYEVNGAMACESCSEQARTVATPRGSRVARVGRAFLAGGAAAVLGALVWYGIGRLTGYELGLIAIVIGWMVGKAVHWGSGHRGGWRYQVIAMLLTYLAIVSTTIPQIVESFAEMDAEMAEIDASEPASTDADQTDVARADAADSTTPDGDVLAVDPGDTRVSLHEVGIGGAIGGFLAATVFLVAFAMALPFLAGFENIMGLIIIGIGLFEAWRQNRLVRLEVAGPFSLSRCNSR